MLEEDLLRLVVEKESWEELIHLIVSREKLDPWNVDLVKLTNSFLRYLRNVRELDFRIPAKLVFVAALLLRLKAEYLYIFEEAREEKKEAREKIELRVGELKLPLRRFPKAQVTLEELIEALRKALSVRERKERRRRRVVQAFGEVELSEDISQRIQKLLSKIEELSRFDVWVKFSELVERWRRENIVDNFIPLLHLEMDKKVLTRQEEFFKEILVKKLS